MEALSTIIQTVVGAIQYPISLIKEDNLLSIEMKIGLKSISLDLQMMEKKVEEYDELQLQELAYEIEDFTECLWSPGALGPVLSVIGKNPNNEHVERIKHFQERIKDLKISQQNGPELGSSTAGAGGFPYAPKEDLVGIDKPIKELVELLSPSCVKETQLKVVSIVGCQGVGKTAIARAVYEDYRLSSQFDIVAWVVTSECKQAEELLNKLSKSVRTVAGDTTSAKLHDILKHKRYLVFIDDVKVPASAWKYTVNNAFPKGSKSSRIIMTTSVRSVAASCSSGRYVYTMPRLEQEDSKKLFWKKVYGGVRDEPVPALANSSEKIISKCDGLPLAIISVAEELSTKGGHSVEHLNSSDCEKAGKTVSAFGEMGTALKQCYDSLPDCHHKTCLLYLSIFPMGKLVKMKSLVRRLKSEGLLGAQDSHNCLDELLDRCFVEPGQSSWNSRDASRCQVHGVMLEYIMKLAMSKNLVKVCEENDETHHVIDDMSTPRVRRLSIQSHTVKEYSRAEDIRSLTMFKSGIFKFTCYKMLRLLDLECCKHLDFGSLDGICELRLLKYLSLQETNITKLPKDIEKLERLETLDIRETDSTACLDLPWKVIMLPKLAYLYGKFKLTGSPSSGTKELEEFLSYRSQLHTLAGLVINNNKQAGTEDIIVRHATRLKKIKLWYAPAPPSCTPHPVPNSSSSSDLLVLSAPATSNARPHFTDPSSAFASMPTSTPTTTYSHAPSPQSSDLLVPPATTASSTRLDSADPKSALASIPTTTPTATSARAPKKYLFRHRLTRLLSGKSSVGSPDSNPLTVNDAASASTFVAAPTPSMDSTSGMQIMAPSGASPGLTDKSELNIIDLIPSIKQRFIGLESVSIESIQITKHFLLSVLTGPSTISSIKLRGQLHNLPHSSILEQVPPRNNLRSLQLFSSGLAIQELSALQSLRCLEYLKLVEVDPAGFLGTDFTVRVNGFQSLKQLCFQAPTLPKLKFEQGAMESLTSLQLLCPDSNQLQETARTIQGITHAKYLNDVVLHHSANTDTQDCWKKAIQEHPHRPCVKKQPEPRQGWS